MQMIIRGWTNDGYQKDLLVMDEQQVRITEERFKEPCTRTGVVGVSFNPQAFLEVLHMEVIIVK